MWGPGAEQGEVLQSSSCKLDLKEPYYRMSQPQAYAVAPDQQQHPLIHAQVFSLTPLSCVSKSIKNCINAIPTGAKIFCVWFFSGSHTLKLCDLCLYPLLYHIKINLFQCIVLCYIKNCHFHPRKTMQIHAVFHMECCVFIFFLLPFRCLVCTPIKRDCTYSFKMGGSVQILKLVLQFLFSSNFLL